MKAVIRLDVPEWQIGQEVHVIFRDTMEKNGVCEAEQQIVRCKDCRWFVDGICEKYGFAHPQDWYCADGEEK